MCENSNNKRELKIYFNSFPFQSVRCLTLSVDDCETIAKIEGKCWKLIEKRIKLLKLVAKFPILGISRIELFPKRGYRTPFKARRSDTIRDIFGPPPPLSLKDEDYYSFKANLNSDGLLGGACHLETNANYFVVKSKKNEVIDIQFESFRLCCSSDVYFPNSDYAGIVLYAYRGKTDWRLNNRHCKSGYTIILDTDKLKKLEKEENWPQTEGIIHGLVYYYIFRCCEIGDAVGEAFSIMKEIVKWNSSTFNARSTEYHDGERIISEIGKRVLDEIIQNWKEFGIKLKSLPIESCRNFPFPK